MDIGGEVAKCVVVRPVGISSEAMTGMFERAVRPFVVVRLMSKVACTQSGFRYAGSTSLKALINRWHVALIFQHCACERVCELVHVKLVCVHYMHALHSTRL